MGNVAPAAGRAGRRNVGADAPPRGDLHEAAISLVFGVYYFAALWLAFRYVERTSVAAAVALLGGYLALGSWLGFHLWRNLPMTTDPQEFEVYAHPPRRGAPRIPIIKRDGPKPPTVSP